MSLQLVVVRHGPTLPDPDVPAVDWELADEALSPQVADATAPCTSWWSSPEPKATQTAAVLTDQPVIVDDRLREVERGSWLEDYDTAVVHHLADPSASVADGWETGLDVRARLHDWICELPADTDGPLGLVTHGLAMCHLHTLLTGEEPDLAWWRRLSMPDVRTYRLPDRRSARLLIYDPDGRLLLFRYHDEHKPPFWATPGGELIGDESFEDAAAREFHEETGQDLPIEAVDRERRAFYTVARSTPARWHERYFRVTAPHAFTPVRDGWTEEERSTIVNHRWWTPDELTTTTEVIHPDWLPPH